MFSIKFDLERSITINQPVEKVYTTVSDFTTWPTWSPWLCQEPDCPVDISGVPGEKEHQQEWNGKRIGSGKMKITQLFQNERIDYDLFFITPWKSNSKVAFLFKEKDGGTEVSWSMQGTLPFFLFFMKKMMSSWVGCDYERGLTMLKEFIETGNVVSKVEVKGVVDQQGFSYIGLENECSIDKVGSAMEEVFTALQKASESGDLPKPDLSLSFYSKYDLVKRSCQFISAFGYFQKPGIPTAGNAGTYVQGEIAAHRAFCVNHLGSYHHLGNGWATAMGCQRSDKLKVDKKIPMYEIYETMVDEVDEKDLKTSIYLPLK